MTTKPKIPLFDRPFALSMGPQRAGTTWLDRYLRARGDICLPSDVKEIFFFDRSYDNGLNFYKDHFDIRPKHKLVMEITATSFDSKEAPQRVYNTFGSDIKMLCPLRHPVIRSYSLYLHYLRYGIVEGSIREAVKQVPQILDSSMYANHLERWYELFGHEKIMLIFQEELETNQSSYITNVCAALSIPYIPPSEEIQGKYNVTTYSRFGLLARGSQYIADILRSYRMYSVINMAKKIGLKKLIFGKERPDATKNNIPDDDRNWLVDQLGYEIERIEKFLGHKIHYWQDISKNEIL